MVASTTFVRAVSAGEESGGTERHVAAQVRAVERDLEAVVVAFTADEWQNVVGAAVALHLKEEGGRVEGDGEGVGGQGRREGGRSGVGAPVDGVDSHAVALADEGYGTTVVAHRVVADGDSEVGTVARRDDVGGMGEVTVGDMPPNDIGGHEAAAGGGIHHLE